MDLNMSNFPCDVLQRIFSIGVSIFSIGVREVWRPAHGEYAHLSVSSAEDVEGGYRLLFKPDRDDFRGIPEVFTLMQCAQVCKVWSDAIIEKRFWDSNVTTMLGEQYAEPWKLGRRWNALFAHVPVPILGTMDQFLSNIGKIETSIRRGRPSFHVYLPLSSDRRRETIRAWCSLEPFLRTKALHLKVSNMTTGDDDLFRGKRVGFKTLTLNEWPLLQSLDVDLAENGILSPAMVRSRTELDSKLEHVVRANLPFPCLKKLSLPTPPNGRGAQLVTLVAPKVEHCFIFNSGYSNDPPGGDMHCNCIWHSQFLQEDKKYRTFVTPYFLHAFLWLGPKAIGYERWIWEWFSRKSHCPDYGVLISERRDGKVYEVGFTLKQFFEEEDLREISIPFRA